MSTDTLERIELDIDFDAPVQCEDVDHVGDEPARWITTHSKDCSYLLCNDCMISDVETCTRYDQVACQCGSGWFPSDWVEFLPL
jgi:hypothetical protein